LESKETKLEIVCPNCEEENTIKLSTAIKCKKCEKDLSKWKYTKISKKIIGAGTAFIFGIAPAYQIGKHMYSEDRYPVATEYSIINSCVSTYSEPLRRVYIKQKKAICVCALSHTMKEIDYDDYTKNENKFLNIFEQKAVQCQ
jgi:ribosomal protein S27E